jgi:hypothetical protein
MRFGAIMSTSEERVCGRTLSYLKLNISHFNTAHFIELRVCKKWMRFVTGRFR